MTSTRAAAGHPEPVLAGQSEHGHRDGRCFESAFASDEGQSIDGAALHAALAARGYSALTLSGNLKRPSGKADKLEATWVVSATLSQAELEAAVAQAADALPKGKDLQDWLQEFTESAQGASFELEHFKDWSAAQWFNHEFGDDDDDEVTTASVDLSTKAFAPFPAALRKTLAASRQVYALRSNQPSDEGADWQTVLAQACEAMAQALGEITGSVELFERQRGKWAYRVW